MTVSHDGENPTAGISYGYTLGDMGDFADDAMCSELKANLDDFVFQRTHTEKVFTSCNKWSYGALEDEFCQSAGVGDAGTTENSVVISAWNDGGCEGNLIFNAVINDELPEEPITLPASMCLAEITTVCPEVANGTGGEFYNSTLAAMENSAAPNSFGWLAGRILMVALAAMVVV